MFLWFKFIRTYVQIALFFYFKKIKVVGHENIPKGKPILFVANHRNGLIDPILITTAKPKVLHFLTRASAFKNPIANFLLRSLNMLPIFRIRDGLDSIKKNQAIFEACYSLFQKNQSVLIFPEGNHGYPRRVRNLSKGFTRIAFGFLDKNQDKELYIVPIGLNYTNILRPFRDATLYYGKPFLANAYYNPGDENQSIERLKSKVYEDLKTLTTHIDDINKHDKIVNILKAEGFDFLDPKTTNERIATLEKMEQLDTFPIPSIQVKSKSIFQQTTSTLFIINTLIPILIWKKIKSKVKDIVMLSTSRFGISVGLIPFFYLLQAALMTLIFGKFIGFIYFISSFVLVYIRKYLN